MYVLLILELLIITFIDILINLGILVVKKMLLLSSNVVHVVNLDNLINRVPELEFFFLLNLSYCLFL